MAGIFLSVVHVQIEEFPVVAGGTFPASEKISTQTAENKDSSVGAFLFGGKEQKAS